MGGAAREHEWVKIDRNFWKSRATAISASRIRQPLRPHRRGPASGAGARSPSLSRCFVFVWPSSHVVYFFGPVCCCRRGPLCVSLVHFLQPRFLGYWKLEICGVHKYQALQTTDRDGGGFLKYVPSFPSPSSGFFVFPLISSGLFVSLSPSRVMVFWNFFRFDSMTIYFCIMCFYYILRMNCHTD